MYHKSISLDIKWKKVKNGRFIDYSYKFVTVQVKIVEEKIQKIVKRSISNSWNNLKKYFFVHFYLTVLRKCRTDRFSVAAAATTFTMKPVVKCTIREHAMFAWPTIFQSEKYEFWLILSYENAEMRIFFCLKILIIFIAGRIFPKNSEEIR